MEPTEKIAIDYSSPQQNPDYVLDKITHRLIPFLVALFIVNYIDRTNVAMASLRMLPDLNFTDEIYGFGAGMFFFGYLLFEVPSNLVLQRVGAGKWLAIIMIVWGFLSAMMMFAHTAHGFYGLRFCLGAAEAGFFPGVVLYLSYWFPARRRAKVMAAFLTATAISGIIGSPTAGAIMQLNGAGGLRGWQWLFMIEGILPVVLGICMLAFGLLPDGPNTAPWLTADEKSWIENQFEQDHGQSHVNHVADIFAAARGGRLWVLSLLYYFVVMGLYAFVFWAPKLIKSFSGSSDLRVGVLSAIPFLVGTLGMILIGASADHTRRRRAHVAGSALIGALGLIGLTLVHGTVASMGALSFAAVGIFGTLGPFWALPTRFLRGTAAAAGIAVINSTGAIAGYVAPAVIGYYVTKNHSANLGLYFVAANLTAGAILVMCVPPEIDH